MRTFLAAGTADYICIGIALFILELIYFKIAARFEITDRPDHLSSHTSATLRGGGIIFLPGAWLYAVFFGFDYLWFLAGLTLVGIVSFADDVRHLGKKTRLIVQFIAMLMMFKQLGVMKPDDWLIVTAALIVCVGIVNAYNFMDGINGITGAYSVAVLAPLIYLNHLHGFVDMPFLYVTAISLLVFCFYNFRTHARCFAGDVGSISIAFILFFAIGKLILATQDFSYIVFLAVYGTDSVLTICHRMKLHENIGTTHRKHAYQLMANELKIPHLTVAALYMTIQLVISFGLILCPVNGYLYLGMTVAALTTAYILFMKKYYPLHDAYLKSRHS